jgi:hypothetical protein
VREGLAPSHEATVASEVDDPARAFRFAMLADALAAAQAHGPHCHALPWAIAMQFAHAATDGAVAVLSQPAGSPGP